METRGQALGINIYSPVKSSAVKNILKVNELPPRQRQQRSYKHKRVVFEGYISPNPIAKSQDSSTQQTRVERDNSIGDIYPDNPVEKANRRFAILIRMIQGVMLSETYRKKGSRPNKTTKTKVEKPKIPRAMVRRSPITSEAMYRG